SPGRASARTDARVAGKTARTSRDLLLVHGRQQPGVKVRLKTDAPNDHRRVRRRPDLAPFDRGKDLVDRPPVVLREIDLGPWKPARADRVQRTHAREVGEGARRPVAQPARADA